MTTRRICPLVCSTVDQMQTEIAAAASAGAEMVELRLDCLASAPDEAMVRKLMIASKLAKLETLVTYRPVRQGGHYDGDEAARLAMLGYAATVADWVDIEDDVPRKLWPEQTDKIILSHHDFERCPKNLDKIVAAMNASDAAVAKIAFMPKRAADVFRAFDVLHNSAKPAIALAMGAKGLVTRLAAKACGAFGTFAVLDAAALSAPGQPTLAELAGLYRWDAQTSETALFGVVGCPVGHSMSPPMHNAAFAKTGFDGLYVPLEVEDEKNAMAAVLDAIAERPWLRWRGLSVTIPHKLSTLAHLGPARCGALAVQIGAANTVTFDAEETRGENTDYAGARESLLAATGWARGELVDMPVAVVGAGGVARAVVAAMTKAEARVTIYNRTLAKAEALASEFGAMAQDLKELPMTVAKALVNCTSVGMSPHEDECIFASLPPSVKVVFDTVYNPLETKLLAMAREDGCVCVDGVEMLARQGARQFEMWTHQDAPLDVMREAVLHHLGVN
jgi:3-dehydroquinate dehydratase / shikimate dehydrogenase